MTRTSIEVPFIPMTLSMGGCCEHADECHGQYSKTHVTCQTTFSTVDPNSYMYSSIEKARDQYLHVASFS